MHLWKRQQGRLNGQPVLSLKNGRSFFGKDEVQMMPPYMLKSENTAEMLMSNMDYARVSGCVVTGEEIDGNQDDYLLRAKKLFGERMKICSLYEEGKSYTLEGFDGIKLCAGRLPEQDLTKHYKVFEDACNEGKFVSIDLADGDTQVSSLREIIIQLPRLRVAIGHFGMVTRDGWLEQIRLARYENVRIESGGITWLFNSEFYPYPSAVDAVNEAAEICSFDKLMWGSDYPRTMTAITYKMSYDFISKSDKISEENKAKFLGLNAKSFYGFSELSIPEYIKNMVE